MAFTSSVFLGDLNDFISPSQACINPEFVSPQEDKQGEAPKLTLKSEIDLPTIDDDYIEPQIIKTTKTKVAKVALTDCLACSGCVTSAETILIEQQSKDQFINLVKSSSNIAILISTQSLASFAAYQSISMDEAFKNISKFLKGYSNTIKVVQPLSKYEGCALFETKRELVSILKNTAQPQIWKAPVVTTSINNMESKVHDTELEICANKSKTNMRPLITSSCPGWVCYVEKQYPEVIPYLSKVVSTEQLAASHFPNHTVIQIEPCPDKKLEASRKDFLDKDTGKSFVDLVLTTTELKELMDDDQNGANLPEIKYDKLTKPFVDSSGSGGYLDYLFRSCALELFDIDVGSGVLPMKQGRNKDFQSIRLKVQGEVKLSFARVYGFRNIQVIIRQLKRGKCPYDFIEIMACPAGCLNGGGQIEQEELKSIESLRKATNDRELKEPEEAKVASQFIYTQFHNVPDLRNPLQQEW